jgi:hypothetical protein
MAETLGGTRMQGPDEVIGGLTMGKFNDPEGHLIDLISPAPRAVTRTQRGEESSTWSSDVRARGTHRRRLPLREEGAIG